MSVSWGSEMCIRDRPRPAPTTAQTGEHRTVPEYSYYDQPLPKFRTRPHRTEPRRSRSTELGEARVAASIPLAFTSRSLLTDWQGTPSPPQGSSAPALGKARRLRAARRHWLHSLRNTHAHGGSVGGQRR
eukprot:6962778-Prymnesium_polylepis.1